MIREMSGYLNPLENILWNINEEVCHGYFVLNARPTNEISVSR